MVIRLIHERWLHLRWCHYYQWKNLLTEEREARRHLEQRHQQQTSQALLLANSSQLATLINAQLLGLAQLRNQCQQKRLAIRNRQHQQMKTLQAQLTQADSDKSFDLFQPFSVLRHP